MGYSLWQPLCPIWICNKNFHQTVCSRFGTQLWNATILSIMFSYLICNLVIWILRVREDEVVSLHVKRVKMKKRRWVKVRRPWKINETRWNKNDWEGIWPILLTSLKESFLPNIKYVRVCAIHFPSLKTPLMIQ